MAENSNIPWTTHTWNPWRGCTKISPGCDNCYMFTEQRRYGNDPEVVVRCGRGVWRRPYRWNTDAIDDGKPVMAFTCSWSDFFHKDADPWRGEAWAIIKQTPHVIYQILTKRPHMMVDRMPVDWGDGYENVWLGVSIEGNTQRSRVQHLNIIPAAVRFVSYEPALHSLDQLNLAGIDWVIYGGESGPRYRPEGPPDDPKLWARQMRDKCAAAGVAFFHKQSANLHPDRGIYLDGELIRQYPTSKKEPVS